jgi:hypothetical protein
MLKAGLVVQHCLLVAVLHVCLGWRSWASCGAANTGVLRSAAHKMVQNHIMLIAGAILRSREETQLP